MNRIVPSDPLSRPAIVRPEVRSPNLDPAADALLDAVIAAPHGCWFTSHRPRRDGYAQIRFGRRAARYAHIIYWEIFYGAVPLGLELDHLCRVRRCVNPEHLEPVTKSENIRRSLKGVRRTVCREGHQISGENAYFVRAPGTYRCKKCYFAENSRRQKVRVDCPECGSSLSAGSVPRHLRESCRGASERAA